MAHRGRRGHPCRPCACMDFGGFGVAPAAPVRRGAGAGAGWCFPWPDPRGAVGPGHGPGVLEHAGRINRGSGDFDRAGCGAGAADGVAPAARSGGDDLSDPVAAADPVADHGAGLDRADRRLVPRAGAAGAGPAAGADQPDLFRLWYRAADGDRAYAAGVHRRACGADCHSRRSGGGGAHRGCRNRPDRGAHRAAAGGACGAGRGGVGLFGGGGQFRGSGAFRDSGAVSDADHADLSAAERVRAIGRRTGGGAGADPGGAGGGGPCLARAGSGAAGGADGARRPDGALVGRTLQRSGRCWR